jgi:hypothetical protein
LNLNSKCSINNKSIVRFDETQVPIEVRNELKLKNEVAMLKRQLAVKFDIFYTIYLEKEKI